MANTNHNENRPIVNLTLKKQWEQIKQAVSFVWKSSPKWTMANAVIIILQGAIPLVTLFLIKIIIDKTEAFLSFAQIEQRFYSIVPYLLLIGFVFIINAVGVSFSHLVKSHHAQITADYMYDLLHRKCVALDLAHYETAKYQDLLYRARQEAGFRPKRIVDNLVMLFQNGLSLLLIAGLLLSLHWIMVVVLLLTSLPGILVRIRYSGVIYSWTKKQTPTERKSRYYHWMLTGKAYAKEIRLFGLGGHFIKRFGELRSRLRDEKHTLFRKRAITELITELSGAVMLFVSYFFITYQAIKGIITLGELVMFFMAFQKGLTFLRQTLSGLAALYEDNLFLSDVNEFLAITPLLRTGAKSNMSPIIQPPEIILENVNFRYPSSSRKVLEGINLTVEAGKITALVGNNGAGKSTIVKLLCRLYDVTQGKILFNGIDVRNFSIDELRKQYSVLFQDFIPYNIPANENIRFGDINKQPDNQTIEQAAKHAGIDDLLRRMPYQYKTVLGNFFVSGEELSTGQWQKVALARAFFRDAPVIIFDEPTSSMDAQSEHDFYCKIRQLIKGKTALLISHRFSTVKLADMIYVLNACKVAESGTHNDLMQKNGIYAAMYRLQSKNYR